MKKTQSSWKSFKKVLLALFMVGMTISQVEATHFRYGSISWRQVSGLTYEFKVTQGWRRSAFGGANVGSTVNVGSLQYTTGSPSPVNLVVSAVNIPEDWFFGEAIILKTFTSAGDVDAFFTTCCRISTLENAADMSLRISTRVNVGTGNNSPVTNVPPIVNVQESTINKFFVPFTDPDGDILTYRFATPAEMGDANYTLPQGISINSATGEVTFNTNAYQNGDLVAVGVVANDGSSTVLADFIIRVVQQSTPPQYDYAVTPVNGYTYQVSPGQVINFDVKAFDVDPGSTVTLSAVGQPTGSTFSPALPSVAANPVSTNFQWTPTSTQFGTYVITFVAQDNNGVQSLTSVSIVVSLKPVFVVPPTPVYGDEISVLPGTNVSFDVKAADPDPQDSVRITHIYNKPATATLSIDSTVKGNPIQGVFSWTPQTSNWGETVIEFEATDKYGDKAFHKIGLIVNTPPVFVSTPDTEVVVGATYNYAIIGFDADVPYGDSLEFAALNLPSWLTLTDNEDGTASLVGSPSIADAGLYTITLFLEDIYHHSANGPTIAEQTFTIRVIPCTIKATGIIATPASCFGTSTGSAHATFTGGFAPFTYSWSNGTSDTALYAVNAGTYSVTITDAFNCSITDSVTISEPTALTTTFGNVSNYNGFGVSCFGSANGSATVTAVGGTMPYTYAWSNGDTSSIVSGLTAGSYIVDVIDANGCLTEDTVSLTQPAALVASIGNVSSYNGFGVSCFGSANGSATVSTVGGTMPYFYTWSNGDTSQSVTGLAAGSYLVDVIDLNGCLTSDTVSITQPTALVATLTSPTVIGSFNTSCSLDGDGSITSSVLGGVSPYALSWSNGSTTTSLTNVLAGTYTLTTTDANGCAVTKSISLTKPSNCNCVTVPVTSGITCASCTKVLDGTSNVNLNTGDVACIVNSYNGYINMNGGTLTICGDAIIPWLNIPNNSTVVVSGTLKANGINFNGPNARLINDGSIELMYSMNSAGIFLNNGTFLAKQGVNLNSQSTFVNNGSFIVKGGDLALNQTVVNNGLISAEKTIYLNSNTILTNNCTVNADAMFVNSGTKFTNNGTSHISQDVRFNSSISSLGAGSILSSKKLYLSGTTLKGDTSSCALVKVASVTEINQATLNGKISLCDANGFEIKNNLVLANGASSSCTTCNYSGTIPLVAARAIESESLTITESNVFVYPNPAHLGDKITSSGIENVVSMTLVNDKGVSVITTTQSQLATDRVEPGLYILKTEDILGNVHVSKIVILND